MMEWAADVADQADDERHRSHKQAAEAVLADPEYAAHEFARIRKEQSNMAVIKVGGRQSGSAVLPLERSEPVADPWAFAYLMTGEKKIGKTTFAIEGCEELVFQFDKPQIAYRIREVVIKSWAEFKDYLAKVEERAAADPGKFPYQRIVIDGAGEWYQMCQQWVCKKFGVEHPSEEGYARAWHKLRDEFTDAVNRLLRLQKNVGCGMIFIAHSEWKEKKTREGEKIERLVPNLPPRAEEILNGKCDAWFTWDYSGDRRIMVVLGDEVTGAGHRIDGHFMTPDGRRVQEIDMGGSSKEALANFMRAFNNQQKHATAREARQAGKGAGGPPGPKEPEVAKRRVVRRA